jgi:polyamine oxidase
MVTTTHIESQRIERMSNHQVKAEIQEVLDTMFSNSEPIQDILIPRWHQHPLFRGSYSNWPIGASREHHANMRAPLENSNSNHRQPVIFSTWLATPMRVSRLILPHF